MKVINVISKGKPYEVIVDDDFEWSGKVYLCAHGYAHIWKDGKNVKLHRYIMGAKKGDIVDHINGNKLDNRRENLRLVTSQENAFNRRTKGVHWVNRDKRWRVTITVDGKQKYIGQFKSKEEAIRAYRKAHVEAFGEFSPWRGEENGKAGC